MLDAEVTFAPREETTFAGLYARIGNALSVLEDVKPEKFEGLEGKEIKFRAGPYEVKYDGVTYLQEVALANCKSGMIMLGCVRMIFAFWEC